MPCIMRFLNIINNTRAHYAHKHNFKVIIKGLIALNLSAKMFKIKRSTPLV